MGKLHDQLKQFASYCNDIDAPESAIQCLENMKKFALQNLTETAQDLCTSTLFEETGSSPNLIKIFRSLIEHKEFTKVKVAIINFWGDYAKHIDEKLRPYAGRIQSALFQAGRKDGSTVVQQAAFWVLQDLYLMKFPFSELKGGIEVPRITYFALHSLHTLNNAVEPTNQLQLPVSCEDVEDASSVPRNFMCCDWLRCHSFMNWNRSALLGLIAQIHLIFSFHLWLVTPWIVFMLSLSQKQPSTDYFFKPYVFAWVAKLLLDERAFTWKIDIVYRFRYVSVAYYLGQARFWDLAFIAVLHLVHPVGVLKFVFFNAILDYCVYYIQDHLPEKHIRFLKLATSFGNAVLCLSFS